MGTDWAEVLTPVAIFGAFGFMLKIFFDYRIKKQLIEKDKVDENVKFLNQSGPETKMLTNLKWGMVLVGIGLAMLISWWFPRQIGDEGTIGLMFLFAGVGFLISAGLASKIGKDKNGGPPQ